jgi:hypothetical protein
MAPIPSRHWRRAVDDWTPTRPLDRRSRAEALLQGRLSLETEPINRRRCLVDVAAWVVRSWAVLPYPRRSRPRTSRLRVLQPRVSRETTTTTRISCCPSPQTVCRTRQAETSVSQTESSRLRQEHARTTRGIRGLLQQSLSDRGHMSRGAGVRRSRSPLEQRADAGSLTTPLERACASCQKWCRSAGKARSPPPDARCERDSETPDQTEPGARAPQQRGRFT